MQSEKEKEKACEYRFIKALDEMRRHPSDGKKKKILY